MAEVLVGLWIAYHHTGKNLMERIDYLEYINRAQKDMLARLREKAPEAFAEIRMEDLEGYTKSTPFTPEVLECLGQRLRR